ncbi:MAG: hypothetical protein QWI36_02375 [Wolbachia endosymbiont of Tyrophagus putrescentiae]|nr:hypothetical protein [Wolbachia endosymbiont of Tyrophagus putrescentiae]
MTTATKIKRTVTRFILPQGGKSAKSSNEQRISDLYTLLGFKGREGFESKIKKFNGKGEYVQVTKKLCNELAAQVERDEESKRIAKNINYTIKGFKSIDDKLNNLLGLKKDAESFLENPESNPQIISNVSAPNSDMVFHEIGRGILAERNITPGKKETFNKVLTSNKQDFEDTLKYISSLESEIGITLEKLNDNRTEAFLSKHVESLSKKYPGLSTKMQDAMKILANKELREFYNQGVREGTLQTIILYQKCKELHEDQLVSDIEKLNELKNIVTNTIDRVDSDFNRSKAAIFNCKTSQGRYEAEQNLFKFRAKYCQQAIEVLQQMVEEHQKKIDECVNPIRNIINEFSEKTRKSKQIAQFISIIDALQMQHNELRGKQKINEDSEKLLAYLADKRSAICSELEATVTVATNLSQTYSEPHKDMIMSTYI